MTRTKGREQLAELVREQQLIETLVRQRQDASATGASTAFSWPLLRFRRVTSPFGERVHPLLRVPANHDGIDIIAPAGTVVRAAGSGTVIVVGRLPAYGRIIAIDHGQGLATVYAHLAAHSTREGDRVERGDAIANVGRSGRIAGTHLHFEVRRDGVAINPVPLLRPSEPGHDRRQR